MSPVLSNVMLDDLDRELWTRGHRFVRATGPDRAELESVDGVPHRQAQQVHRGWTAYHRLADAEPVFRSLDGWLRRRLRQVRWKEWKSTAAKRHNLRIRGISESNARKWAGSSKGHWRVAGSKVLQVSLPNAYWNRLGLKTLSQTWQRLNPTA
jgi:hypothetical protein